MAGPNKNATARDMIWTIIVLMVPVLLITWFFTRDPEEPPVTSVDWQSVVAQAQQADEFEVQTLKALPAGWTATKAVWVETGQVLPSGDPAGGPTLELGFLADHQVYFAINQTSAPAAPYLVHVTREGTPVGPVEAAGREWQHYLSADRRTHSLVHTSDAGVTTVLVSDAGVERLSEVAGLLE
ncbi:DUF4245 domain-containing protein [Propionibacteriaceae bacterium Y1923]